MFNVAFAYCCEWSARSYYVIFHCQDSTGNRGVHNVQHAAPCPLLTAQADLGFAHVTERCCEDLLANKGKPVPDGDEGSIDRKTDLALACIAAIKPDLTDVEAATRLNTAFIAEHPDCYAELLVDVESLEDVLPSTESKKVAEYEASVKMVKAKQALALQTREQKLHKYFKKAPAPKYTAAQKKQPRWLPKR